MATDETICTRLIVQLQPDGSYDWSVLATSVHTTDDAREFRTDHAAMSPAMAADTLGLKLPKIVAHLNTATLRERDAARAELTAANTAAASAAQAAERTIAGLREQLADAGATPA